LSTLLVCLGSDLRQFILPGLNDGHVSLKREWKLQMVMIQSQ
jgi:hypothetical protein